MALTANFVADFSSFMDATKDAVSAMQGFKLTAQELGPAADRGLADTQKQMEQVGRGVRTLAIDVVAASQPFIAAFSEEQAAVSRLNVALQNTGQATPEVIAQYAALATQFQRTTVYADEAVTAAMATLTTIGRVGPQQMELALTAVTNLASGMKIDLATAAMLVSKAFESGGEHLGKLKTILGEAYKPGMDAAEMLQAINEKFGGSAAAEAKTYEGQMKALMNTLSDFNEKIGKVLVENLSALMSAFQKLPEPVQTFTVAVVAIGTAVAPVLVSLASLVSILSTTGLGASMVTGLTAVVAVLTGPVGIAIAAAAVAAAVIYNWDKIVAVTQRLYEGIKTWLVDRFGGLVAAIQEKVTAIVASFRSMYQLVVGGSIVPDMIDGIGRQFGRLDAEMVQPVRQATQNSLLELARWNAQANAILAETTGSLAWGGPTRGQLERIAAIPIPGRGGSSAPVTVNNEIHIVDTERNLASRVSQEIMRTVRSGTQLSTT